MLWRNLWQIPQINKRAPERSHVSTCNWLRSETTLNYQMTVKRYPKPNSMVGSSIPNIETFSLLDGITNQVVKSTSPDVFKNV